MRERYDLLLEQAEAAFADGELQRSAEIFAEAEELARANDLQDLADRAFCNRCAVLIELDQGSEQIPRLKQILLRSSETRNRWLASYYTAVAYDVEEDSAKAASYARRAMELAGELEEPEIQARSANLAGNLALRDSRFDEAEAAYEVALANHRGLDGYHRIMEAQEKDNMGYVLMCTDRVRDGIRLCEEARDALTAMEAEHYLYQALQDLCYGYLLDEDLNRASDCGREALDLALEDDEPLVVKNCLFLLSEIAVRQGDTFSARRYLRDLATHYPEVGVSEEIIDVFLTTDLTAVVNLRG